MVNCLRRCATVITAAGLLVIVFAAMAASTARAQAPAAATPQTTAARPTGPTRDSVLEAQVRALSSELRCPVCQGLSLQDSPSELSQEMRDVIRDQLRAGRSPEQVRAYFVAKYGEWVLLEPEPEGFNLVVYALPILAVLGGGLLLVLAMRRWTSAPGSSASDVDLSSEHEPRVTRPLPRSDDESAGQSRGRPS